MLGNFLVGKAIVIRLREEGTKETTASRLPSPCPTLQTETHYVIKGAIMGYIC